MLKREDLIGDGRGEEESLARGRTGFDDGAEIGSEAGREQTIRFVKDLKLV